MQPAQTRAASPQFQQGSLALGLSFARPGYDLVVASGLLISLPL